jgi:hypothetical protein
MAAPRRWWHERAFQLGYCGFYSSVCLALRFDSRAAGCDSPGCGLLAARLLLSCRLPDFLLRLLKWLNQSDANLMQQRSNIVVVQQSSSSTTILAQQIDRIRAHLSVEYYMRCASNIKRINCLM